MGISLPSSGANNTSPFVADDVVFRPKEFTTTITTWGTVPYCDTDFAPYNNTAVDHLATVHNPTRGIGDICRYMGEVDGSLWRIPTSSELVALYNFNNNGGRDTILGNGWTDGNYYPLSGRAMGAGQNYAYINYETLDTDARVTNADPYINGAVFLPASGWRHTWEGVIFNIGSNGDYWSLTAANNENGHSTAFNSTTVAPQASHPRTYGFSVRCIRE